MTIFPGRWSEHETVWTSSRGEALTCKELQRRVESLRQVVSHLPSHTVGLGFSSDEDLAVGLLAFAGVRRLCVVIPAESKTELVDALPSPAVLIDGSVESPTLSLLHDGQSIHDLHIESPSIGMFTSGTTGTPKLIVHDIAALERPLRKVTARRSEFVWGSLYGISRFAGLQVLLQALFGLNRFVFPSGGSFSEVLTHFAKQGVSALSATPTAWKKALMHRELLSVPLVQITLGGEIADQGVLDALSECFPTARITHIYASTEAGVIFSVKDRKTGFPLSYLDMPELGVSIREDGMLMVRRGQGGNQIVVESGDLVEVAGDRVLFRGRESGVINVGGQKVFPERVEAVLREVPGVVLAQVQRKKNSFVGELVEAVVVPSSECGDLVEFRRELVTHCQQRLARHEVPSMIRFAPQLPTTSSGKLVRI